MVLNMIRWWIMQYLKVSEFLAAKDIDLFVLGCFYSRLMPYPSVTKVDYIYTYSSFRQSQKINPNKFDFHEYANYQFTKDLNTMTWPRKWVNKEQAKRDNINVNTNCRAIFILVNDLKISLKSFFERLYFKVAQLPEITSEMPNKEKNKFIRGFLETRGSIDTTRPFLTTDYFYNSLFELKKVRVLSERMNVPSEFINLNFRNLQAQFLAGNHRNPQLRVNLHWYASSIGFVNRYKALTYEKIYGNSLVNDENGIYLYSKKLCGQPRSLTSQFNKYLQLYSDHIFNKELDKTEIVRLRKELDFDKPKKQGIGRNTNIVKIFSEYSEDKCASCGTSKTSTNKRTGRQNFDIHHFIPFKVDEVGLDNIDNLVKLCPTCHASLKRGRATKEEQIAVCKRILENEDYIYEFSSAYLQLKSIDEIAAKVQTLLK